MIRIKSNKKSIEGEVDLPMSKSETNRVLILEALSEGKCFPNAISEANDSVLLNQLLTDRPSLMDCQDAGTVMRFMTAFCSIQEGEWILTGHPRLLERPIGPLVAALIQLGADIQYLDKIGYPPIKILGKRLQGGSLTMKANVSSQFLTALFMIAPYLTEGLNLEIQGPMVSEDYTTLTIQMMEQAGIQIEKKDRTIRIFPGQYSGCIQIGGDYSAASYWFECVALSKGSSRLLLKGLLENSFQPDRAVINLFKSLGVESKFVENGLLISSDGVNLQIPESSHFNLIGQPDLAQTLVCTCAGLEIKSSFEGLETLKIKETDRIKALELELNKLGANLSFKDEQIHLSGQKIKWNDITLFTHQDHRMAMALAPLVTVTGELWIEDHQVVKKSYPQFWSEFGRFFEIEYLHE
ncbi:MAG: 3-phosphoshikimate 1-carboxyvinyltransferase [Saprospiraceae bacterium]|nr:3-phosphoshikimate 1-carboxyvinyltransferase [Saprospiraceae bacterium]MBK9631266.1 3-phosphoshikimate 1-carboxyvinyltransferase [Saprospiraceae bacterium]